MLTLVGAGSVGVTLATYLAAAGEPVEIYARSKDLPVFSGVDQLRLDLPHGGSLAAPRPPLTTEFSGTGAKRLLLATKFSALDGLLDEIEQHHGHGGEGLMLISTLNGVRAAQRLRERMPKAEVAVLTIMFNAQHLGPLHAQLTTKPAIILAGGDDALRQSFAGTGLHLSRAKGDSACWGKLLINLANAIGALTHSTFRDLLSDPDLRAIFVATLDEAADRLHASHIHYKLPMPLPYGGYRWLLQHGGPLPWKLAQLRNGLADGAYPSMVSDVEAGRPTEVRQLNGEIVALGEQLKWPTPINAQLVSLVEAITDTRQPAFNPASLRKTLGL